MQKSESPVSSEQKNLLDAAEWMAVAASFGGSLAAVLLQQFAFAAIPLSMGAALNLCNRKQKLAREACLMGELHASMSNLEKVVDDFRCQQDSLISEFNVKVEDLDKKFNNLQSTSQNLRLVQNCTQQILNSPPASSASASAYYMRATGHHRLGGLEEAILDYGEAITRDPKHAKAYFNRGKANATLGRKQEAVEDLRDAAKVFFEAGNIESYSKAKELSVNMHQLAEQQSPENFDDEVSSPELVVMEGLFI